MNHLSLTQLIVCSITLSLQMIINFAQSSGNSRTVMVANIGPADYNYDETITTLRYANRAKNIKNKPKINEDPKDALLRQFQSEIQRLRKILESKTQGGGKVKRRVRRMSDTGEEEEVSEEEVKYFSRIID